MITQGDDYPIHQTPEPVQQVFTSDRNFYDRFFFNGYFREGEPYFAAAMGIYPNIGMIDCAFSVIVGGVQHCVRASRVLGAERLDTRVGPIAIRTSGGTAVAASATGPSDVSQAHNTEVPAASVSGWRRPAARATATVAASSRAGGASLSVQRTSEV